MTAQKKRQKQRVLAYHGRRGEWVRVFANKRLGLVRVQWKEKKSPKITGTESWPDTEANRALAIAWAEGLWERMISGANHRPSELTLLEMWQAYAADQFSHLRPRSQKIYAESFQFWMTFFGERFLVDRTTVDMMGTFRGALVKRGLKINTIRGIIGTVKMVYNWALSKELITTNKVALYKLKIAKEDRPKSPDEYTATEYAKMLATFKPESGYHWRGFAALVLIGCQGVRQNAALHVKLDDIELGHAEVTDDGKVRWVYGRITWRAEWDKMGKEWSQPLRLATQIAIEIALEWRERVGYTGEWLLPPAQPSRNKGFTYDQQSLWWAIRRAEERAGIEHREWRAGHGARRMVSGDVAELTGDMLLGLRAIGDTDPRRAVEYIKTRDDRMVDAFSRLDNVTASPSSRSLQRRPNQSGRTPSIDMVRNQNQNETPRQIDEAPEASNDTQPVVTTEVSHD